MGRKDERTKRETVLVTGAAGTVGGYVVRELIDSGHRVIATDRAGARFDFGLPPGAAVEVRPGDLTDLSFAVDVLAGADSVIHLAALVDLTLPEAVIRRVNYEAVRSLYEVARSRGCRRFVFFSSGSIYRKIDEPMRETTPIAPQTHYERSKADAEAYLFAMRGHQPAGPEVVVIRPSMIYGPRARFLGAKLALLPPMMATLLRRVPRLRGGAVCNWAHGEDVARAAAFLLDEPRAAWEAYNVADDDPVAFGDLVELITRLYGLPLGPVVPLPARIVGVVGPAIADQPHLLALMSRATRGIWERIVEREGLVPAIDPSLERETFLYASAQAVFATDKIKALGFGPKWASVREGYPDVLRWFQAQRWLPVYGTAPSTSTSTDAPEAPTPLRVATGQ